MRAGLGTKPRLLDLFCGAGGAAMGYKRAGFRVVGIDNRPQPRYCGDGFERADALEALQRLLDGGMVCGYRLEDFAGIHASPPCQFASDLAHHPQNRHIEYPNLVAPTRELVHATGLPYVIENVSPRAGLVAPVTICGASLGLDVRRHRLFEANFDVMVPPCACGGYREKKFDVFRHGETIKSATVPVYGTGGGKAAEHWAAAMGIDWMTRQEMAQAIPPVYTEHIGHYLMAHLQAQAQEAA